MGFSSERAAVCDPLAPLLASTLKGDAAARQALLEQLMPCLRRAIGRQLREQSDVDDVLQETLLAILEAVHGFRGETSVLHFCRKIAVRRAVSHLRELDRRTRLIGELGRAEHGSQALAGPALELVLAMRRQASLESLLARLPASQAQTLRLRFLRDYQLEQVACETGVPVNTVRTRVKLACKSLRRFIEADRSARELFNRSTTPCCPRKCTDRFRRASTT